MIPFLRHKYGLPYHQLWFARQWTWCAGWGFTVYRQYLGEKKPSFPFFREPFYTVLIDLVQDDEVLLSGMNRSTKAQIRKAETDGFQLTEMTDREQFRLFYNDFADEKGLSRLTASKWSQIQHDLRIFKVDLREQILVAHAYLLDQKEGRVRFLYGASARLAQDVDTNLVGRANRWAHFHEMQKFRADGFRVFDFGGYAKGSLDPQKMGINQFKESFGGKIVAEDSYMALWPAVFHFLRKS